MFTIFNRGIDNLKITPLSNHKAGILNNYIRIENNNNEIPYIHIGVIHLPG
jgi:hypothetical protein